MPRPPIHSPLPALREVLPDFDRLQRTTGKAEQIADALRGVAQNGRAPENLPFYSTREIAGFFGVSQQTATFAVARLEHEGLVRRIRGSQTLLLGRRSLARAPARAVAAIPLETMESRYSYLHIRLSRELTDNLWKHRILADIVPYADPSLDPTHSQSPLDERLIRHRPDFVIWIAPLPTRRDVLLRLNDQGVRNLIVGFDADRGIPPHIVIDLLPTCRRFLEQQWRAAGIRVVRIIRSTILRRERAATLAALAAELGFDADILTSTSQLPRQLDKMYRRNSPIGIVLPDERSAAEFAFLIRRPFAGSFAGIASCLPTIG